MTTLDDGSHFMHRIRLRGPWTYQVLARFGPYEKDNTGPDTSGLPAGRIQMPTDWGATLGRDFRGRVRYQRRFNRPTGLDGGQLVYLAFQAVDCFGDVSLNETAIGRVVGDRPDQRFLVTSLLEDVNELTVIVELPWDNPVSAPLPRPAGRDGLPGGLIGEVCLEIEEHRGQDGPARR